ncbi:hypothetical protein IFM89_021932 [Coptis chinensis]|uniref:RIN4 pathogenic type III effector avirulence factor Avr cleavage site domain-containing protein n=1 Tax=Coptis chinensis TaxID=261450 RepID=A0A835LMD3_9MAGN|nr:hypothetical protein IFM89_021932 [Coptis chinensis]
MENRREKPVWMSVPQFGGWDHKTGAAPDYSMVFTRARANRKEVKKETTRSSIGNEQELIVHNNQDDAIARKKKILTYFNCCIKA